MSTVTKKIAIDCSVLAYNREGIGQYVQQLLTHIPKLKNSTEFYLILNNTQPVPEVSKNIHARIIRLPQIAGIFTGFRTAMHTSYLCKQKGITHLISTHSHLLPIFFQPTIWLIHDISPLTHPEYFPSKPSIIRNIQKLLFRHAARRAKLIATNSEFSRQEVLDYFKIEPGKVVTISTGPGVWSNKTTTGQKEVLEKWGVSAGKYFIAIGTISPRKDYPTLLKAFAQVAEQSDWKLLIAGKKGWMYEPVFKLLGTLCDENPRLKKQIIIMDYVADEELFTLAQNAAALIQTSTYEGFGMPPLDAVALGTGIVVSDIEIFREVYGSIGIFFKVGDNLELASKLKAIITKGKLIVPADSRQQLLDKYNWNVVTSKLLELTY